MAESSQAINPNVVPSGDGCLECDAIGGWWVHLRRCAECGHIGCCDSSPAKHAAAHFRSTSHNVIQSFEPGENWFWDYSSERYLKGPKLADPQNRPESQAAPGPAERVPADWQSQL